MKNRLKISLITLLLAMHIIQAKDLNVSNLEQTAIFNEAEDWIDDMPEGWQDIKTDAILHSMRGFSAEIQKYRNFNSKIDSDLVNIPVKDINGGGLLNVRMRLYGDIGGAPKPLLIFFHGGGWSMGSLENTDNFCRALVKNGDLLVLSSDYPLAPENPYPSALNTCTEIVKYVYSRLNEWNVKPGNLSIGGEGAGGNLAMASAMRIEEAPENKLDINSVVLYYPLLEVGVDKTLPSWRKYTKGYGFDSRYLDAASQAYLIGIEDNPKDNSTRSPFVSPYLISDALLQKLPSILIIAAGRDILIDRQIELAERSDKIELINFEGALHGFLSDGQQKTAFKKAVEITRDFLVK